MIETETILEKAAVLKAAGVSFALATVVRCEAPTSAKPGAKAIIEQDGLIQGWIGGGCAQPAVIKMSLKAIADGQSRLIRISPSKKNNVEQGIIDFNMNCFSGGTLDIFIDPVIKRPGLLIIGASVAAQNICRFAKQAGFTVSTAFPGAQQEMFPDADHIIDSFDLTELSSDASQFVVVATQGKRDESGLEAALSTASSYITFVASDRKSDTLRQYLKECGHDKQQVDAIISPAGIEIGAVTPEEIALSVVAALIKSRRKNTVTTEDQKNNSYCCSTSESDNKAKAIDPVCGMAVDPDKTEFSFKHQSKFYYFCCDGCLHRFSQAPEKYGV